MSKSSNSSFWGEGDHPLDSSELSKVKPALGADTQRAFVRGRTDGKRAVWVLTDSRLISVGMGWFGRTAAWPLTAVAAFEEEEGSHGMTLRVLAAGARSSLIAIAPAACTFFVEMLAKATNVTPTYIKSRKVDPRAQRAEPAARSYAHVATAAAPAAAELPAPSKNDDLMASLERAAAMHRDGLLTDAEFAALKQRILQPAN